MQAGESTSIQPTPTSIYNTVPARFYTNEKPTQPCMSSLDILKTVFGYQSFKPGQLEAIEALRSGKDTIVIIPTGGGKTATYALPCIMTPGVAIVISPLMLMFDQVQRLRSLGINPCFYNTLLSDSGKENIVYNLRDPKCQYHFVFASPEAIVSDLFQDCLRKLKNEGRLSFFIVDEAHCISTWGSDFRPAFQQLEILRKFDVPIAALTGTATEDVIHDIQSTLQMNNPHVVKMPCRRDNLKYSVVPKKENHSKEQVAEMIANDHIEKCGIVYCSTQGDTVEMAYVLKERGISATFYHAGLDRHERLQNASLWLNENVQVMCCTNAFGMGNDKKNVRFIIHHTQPASLADYVQESGRGGRDGETCHCILLFRFGDRMFHLRNIAKIETRNIKESKLQLLNKMSQFCTDKTGCRVQKIALYFGEDEGDCCTICDICHKGIVSEEQNFTEQAKKVLSCLASLIAIQPNVRLSDLVMTYMGSKAKAITSKGFQVVPLYGTGKNEFKNVLEITGFVHHLIFNGLIIENISSHETRMVSTNLVPGTSINFEVKYSL